MPSLEKVTPSAEIPARYGTNWRVFESKRSNSPRACSPITNSFLPSLLGTGARKFMGPAVKTTGWPEVLRKGPPFSGIAQILLIPLRVDWKTKYLPSRVQVPQHSFGGWFQPSRRGWSSVPSADTYQSEIELVLESCRV